jgi:hypothetical protein
MTIESRTQALLDLVEEDRTRRCAEILGRARGQAAAIVAQARAEAAARVRAAFAEERHRLASRMTEAQARLATHRRLRKQHVAAQFVAKAQDALPKALCERWQRAQARSAWVARAVAEARAALPEGRWRITHAAGLTDEDKSAVRADAQFEVDAGMRAGLRIAAGGNVVDGSLAGLLADRVEIGARLLDRLEPEEQ